MPLIPFAWQGRETCTKSFDGNGTTHFTLPPTPKKKEKKKGDELFFQNTTSSHFLAFSLLFI